MGSNPIGPTRTMDLQNKVAWITGGARMGVTVGQILAKEGCRIAFTYRHSRDAAEEAVRQVLSLGGHAAAFRCDVSQLTEVRKTVGQIDRHFKRLDILVHMAGTYQLSPAASIERKVRAWDDDLRVDARGAYALSLAVAPLMKRSGGGRLVHFSDWTPASGRPRYKDYAPYYVAKAAVKANVEALALELAPEILVNAIAPGPILPPKGLSRREYKAVIQATPVQRWGGAEEIAKAVRFLAETDFVTGETIRVDGGRHLY